MAASVMACSKGILKMLAEVLFIFTALCAADSYTPNIIIITADDIGYNDVGFNHQGDGETYTHFLDFYAPHSMALKNYYVMPNGHSTRSALLTAKHPAVLGTQFEMTDGTMPFGLDPSHKLLPEYLKKLGYSCHAVGQWDLGFYSRDMLPTERGYDSFFGSYLPYGDYKTHRARDEAGHEALDLHNNMDLDTSQTDVFKTELYGDKAEEIIANHDYSKQPLHLYLALQSAQIRTDDYETLCKGADGRSQIPNDYYRLIPDVEDPVRKCFLAMVAAVDQVYGRVMTALENKLALANSVVIFTSTSGGPSAGKNVNGASNYPFRGSKLTGYEGGVRGVALVYTDRVSMGFPTSDCMFHVTDWIPTLLSLYSEVTGTLVTSDAFSPMYGKDQYQCVFQRRASNRYNIIHFLYGNSASVLKHQYKYIVNTDKQMATMNEWYSGDDPDCPMIGNGLACDPRHQECLFDLSQDQCEAHNIASLYDNESIVKTIIDSIVEFNKTVKYDSPSQSDPRGLPGVSWEPWIDSVNAAADLLCSPILSIIPAVLLTVKHIVVSS